MLDCVLNYYGCLSGLKADIDCEHADSSVGTSVMERCTDTNEAASSDTADI